MELVDTHCHIHFKDFPLDAQQAVSDAISVGVTRLICVGTTLADSRKAIDFASKYSNIRPAVGVHPHDAVDFLLNTGNIAEMSKLINTSDIVALGEIGLDYFKDYSPREEQKKAFKLQIETGIHLGLPFIFHVRDAWDDFFEIFDSYQELKGVVHSFSAHQEELDEILKRGLLVGLNGIMTFTKDDMQLLAAKNVPLNMLVLETDSPFLAPKPFRGQTCEPKYVKTIAEFLAELRGETLEELTRVTTSNALTLFNLK